MGEQMQLPASRAARTKAATCRCDRIQLWTRPSTQADRKNGISRRQAISKGKGDMHQYRVSVPPRVATSRCTTALLCRTEN